MNKKFLLVLALIGISAQADVIFSPQPATCIYINQNVVQATGCGSPICFADIQCGRQVTSAACLAPAGQCPNAKACVDDPNVQFVNNGGRHGVSEGTTSGSAGAPVAK